MNKIRSYRDLKDYIDKHPSELCWYGPKASDINGLKKLIKINGTISCYGKDEEIPSLSNDKKLVRKKCSIDDLAHKLSSNKKLDTFTKKNSIASILPYDTNVSLEKFCSKNGIRLLSSSDQLKDVLRDKTKVDRISSAINLPTIPGVSGSIDNFKFEPLVKKFGLPLFLHFAVGAGGSGNFIVQNKNDFEKIKKKRNGQRLNVKQFFKGSSCSIDICVTKRSILCGALEQMIIGTYPLNSNPTEYVGSSWFKNGYSLKTRKRINDIGIRLGKYLRQKGFLGFFHPDFLVDGDEIFLTELNMRFGGSCGAYTDIQVRHNQVPLMLAHYLSLAKADVVFDQDIINMQTLKPKNFGLIVIKNNLGYDIKLKGDLKNGIYKTVNNRLVYFGSGGFDNLNKSQDILVRGLPELPIKTIEQGAFICEVITRFQISNTKSGLNKRGISIAEVIFNQLAKR